MGDKTWQNYFYSDAYLVCGAISIKFDGRAEFIGSATYLAPGIFITAKHVIEEPLRRTGHLRDIEENKRYGQYDTELSSKDFIIEVVQFLKLENKVAQSWNILWINFSHDMDVAILTADSARGPITELIPTLPVISVNIHPIPKKNEIVSYGYFGDPDKVNNQADKVTTHHSLSFQGREGKILNLHLSVVSIADPPVFGMDNRIEHMMSGGPTCDSEGSVIAINSSSLEPEEVGGANRSIATLLLRNMFMKFNYLINGSLIKTSLYDLAKEGKIGIVGHEHLSQDDQYIRWSPSDDCLYCKDGTVSK